MIDRIAWHITRVNLYLSGIACGIALWQRNALLLAEAACALAVSVALLRYLKRQKERRAALAELVREAQEWGFYD